MWSGSHSGHASVVTTVTDLAFESELQRPWNCIKNGKIVMISPHLNTRKMLIGSEPHSKLRSVLQALYLEALSAKETFSVHMKISAIKACHNAKDV